MTHRPTRVLWTSNIVLPTVAEEFGAGHTPFGGWLSSMINRLAARSEIRLGVAMRADVPAFRHVEKEGVDYFALPSSTARAGDVADADCRRTLSQFSPDILHVQGAEMPHALRFLESWDGPRMLSIQGVLHGIAPYELGRLPIHKLLLSIRPKLLMTALALLFYRRFRFAPRLDHERKAMAAATHVVGRTLWDHAYSWLLAPQAIYIHCGETLRAGFYNRVWAGAQCERHTIFIGSGAAPRKGAHVALKALSLLRKDFPDIRLYVAGEDPMSLPMSSLKRHFGYPSYLLDLIKCLGLTDRVTFTGMLNEADMAERMAMSHAYLMCSMIENSPNTMGEAMLLGVPVVSSFVGGAPSMARDESEALFYRDDDPVMLAFQVRRIWEDSDLAARLSAAGRARALANHDPERNLADLLAAYQSVLNAGTQV